MKRHTFTTMSVALLSLIVIASSAVAQLPGPAPADTAIAEYDANTGGIVISYNGINSWFIESDPFLPVFDGPDDASAVLPQFPGLVTDNDLRIGESLLSNSVFTLTDLSLGAVAQTGLLSGGLKIFWTTSLGGPEQNGIVGGGVLGQLGDHDGDGDVDGRDFLLAQAEDGITTDVEENFGANVGPLGASIAAVPEPASLLLLAMAGFALATSRRRN